MNYFMKLFKSRDNPKNRLNGSSYSFLWVEVLVEIE